MAILYVVQKIKEKTEQEISDLLFPGSGYEFIIYLTAVLIGFYNITKGSLIDNLIVITFVTLFLTFLILFSKKVRILLQLVLKTIK